MRVAGMPRVIREVRSLRSHNAATRSSIGSRFTWYAHAALEAARICCALMEIGRHPVLSARQYCMGAPPQLKLVMSK